MKRIPFLDSHTGGEPTRLIESLPFPLKPAPVSEQLTQLERNFDHFRRAILNEPRGSEVLVGAYLLPPAHPSCQLGVIFFNNVGYLGMCGHGTIGLMASLSYRSKIAPGTYRIETPVGIVEATLHPLAPKREEESSPLPSRERREVKEYPNRVSIRNVPAYRLHKHIAIEVDGRVIHGDVAWGGNWFFLCHDHGLEISPRNLQQLTEFASRVRKAYTRMGLTAPNGHEIDHVELFAPSEQADSRNFVLCPGKAYDRSPCGTGTSAKLACLAADGKLTEGQVWRQQSVIGSIFEGTIQFEGEKIIPTITGEAWVMAEGSLLMDERDPFGEGIP
ncbi:MAG: 4-hydroxyproline epimerase [Anaerolineales bacterium]